MSRRGWLACLAPGLVAVALACAPQEPDRPLSRPAYQTPSPTPTPAAKPTRTPTPTPSPTPAPAPEPTPVPAAGGVRAAGGAVNPLVRVTQLRIPRFGVDSAVERIGILPGNQLDTPHNPHNTGWYYIYDAPGRPGNAVFSAHVDYYPDIKGPFNRIAQMAAGDQVVVVADGQELVYEVTSYRRYSASNIPMGALIWPSMPAGEEWITLITCGGRFVSSRPGGPGEYLDRDVVVARRVQ